jgi:hypothetical protein
LLLGGVGVLANDSVDSAVKRLSVVEHFAFGPVGDGGETSEGESDFKLVILQRPGLALKAFEKLYATGNPQGRSYALAGIKILYPKRFKELVASAGASTDQVEVQRGCIVTNESLGDVAKQIDRGDFQIPII